MAAKGFKVSRLQKRNEVTTVNIDCVGESTRIENNWELAGGVLVSSGDIPKQTASGQAANRASPINHGLDTRIYLFSG